MVDVVVAMNEPVSQAYDGRPRDPGPARPLLGWNPGGRLTDDLQQPDDGEGQEAVGIKITRVRPRTSSATS